MEVIYVELQAIQIKCCRHRCYSEEETQVTQVHGLNTQHQTELIALMLLLFSLCPVLNFEVSHQHKTYDSIWSAINLAVINIFKTMMVEMMAVRVRVI